MKITRKIQKTPQLLFDFVVEALWSQGVRSETTTTCCYRTVKKGKVLKCAVGLTIPDSVYDKKFEGKTVYKLAQYLEDRKDKMPEAFKWIKGFSQQSLAVLKALQMAHDSFLLTNTKTGRFDRYYFRDHMSKIADCFKLDKTVLDKIWPME